MGECLVSCEGISKRYRKKEAVKNCTFSLEQGKIYGLVGENGAGKTTIMRMLTGICRPTEGKMTVCKELGCLVEYPALVPSMSAGENLELYRRCSGVEDRKRIDEILKLIGLEKACRKKVSHFSLGMKQRLGIGIALLNSPRLLLLDEPTNGLDPMGIVQIKELLLKLNSENKITILISSHNLLQLDQLVTDWMFLKNGVLVEKITKEELYEKMKSQQIDSLETYFIQKEEG